MAIAVAVALAIGGAALTLAPPLTGRLHPGLVPGLLALVLTIAAVAVMFERHGAAAEAAPSRGRPVIAAALAVVILAFGVRTLGIFPAAFLSATVAALGVAGVTPRRAPLIGLGLSAGISLLFAMALRQPLPILPPGLLR